jgi:hypothetical protein
VSTSFAVSVYRDTSGEAIEPKGLVMQIRDDKKHPPHADPIFFALQDLGFQTTSQENKRLDEATLRIVVGSKPR